MTRLAIAEFDLSRRVSGFFRMLGVARQALHVTASEVEQETEQPEVTMTMETVVKRLDRMVTELAELRMQCTPAAQREHPKVIRSGGARRRFKNRRWKEQPNCEFCDRELRIDEVTVDHKLPRCRGGDDSDENLVICCGPCNSTKGAMTAEEFERAIQAGLRVKPLRRSKSSLDSFKARRWNRHRYCELCDKQLKRDEAQLARKLPRSRGGDDAADNLILCCSECQAAKGEQTAEEFLKDLRIKAFEAQET